MDSNNLIFKNEEDFMLEEEIFNQKLIDTDPKIITNSFLITPVRFLRNPEFIKWNCTSRSGTFWHLYSYIIRQDMENKIATYLYKKYYLGKKRLVARFTQEKLSKQLNYKGKQAANNHLSKLIDEGVIQVCDEHIGNIRIKIYDFGHWKFIGDKHIEFLHVHKKFDEKAIKHNQKKAEDNLEKMRSK